MNQSTAAADSADKKKKALLDQCASYLNSIAAFFTEPVKISLLIRNPSRPDGSRDVFLTNEESVDSIVAAMKQIELTGEKFG